MGYVVQYVCYVYLCCVLILIYGLKERDRYMYEHLMCLDLSPEGRFNSLTAITSVLIRSYYNWSTEASSATNGAATSAGASQVMPQKISKEIISITWSICQSICRSHSYYEAYHAHSNMWVSAA
jgi:hypothetical protein